MEILPDILSAISSVGFPIVCVCVMFYERHKDQERHLQESKEFTEALNNNTLVIQKLVDTLSGGKNNGNL